jgi:DnaJ family protein C protein 7
MLICLRRTHENSPPESSVDVDDSLFKETPDPTISQQDAMETPESLPSAEQVKEQGNTAFKAKNYSEAIDLYSKAIGTCSSVCQLLLMADSAEPWLDLTSTEPAYFTNRAAAYMALKKFKPALADCQQAASLQSSSPSTKTLIRLARCQLALASSVAALSTLRTVLELEPRNASAIQLQSKISELNSHISYYQTAKAKKDWGMARLALDKCLQSIEGEGGDIPVEWRLWRIELELVRSNWDSANVAAK